MEIFIELQVNIPLYKALEQMPVYAKFMKYILTRKCKPMCDENISLAEECSVIIQHKLPPKLTDPGRFTISCVIGSMKIGQALCDLGANINLIPLYMMKKLNYGEQNSKKKTLTLSDKSITYPYAFVKDVLVRVDDLLFSVDFVILEIPEDVETPLLLGRTFLVTTSALIDVEMVEFILQFNKK